MTDSRENDWTIREMEEGEIDAVVDRFFAAYPEIERGPQRMDSFGGHNVDFSMGGMVREEIASMFTGTRYRVPFETKTVVALREGHIVGSLSMHKGDAEWQMAYILYAEGGGAERINEELFTELLKACQGWGVAENGIIPRHSPPWFYA